MSQDLHVVYLHGFASSPRSRKATFFARKLTAEGARVDVPTLDGGDFQNLTITGQLRVVEQYLPKTPVVLIGSSLGGYLAALCAARHPQVTRILLLAPAFRFHDLWTTRMGDEELARWKEAGSLPMYHYGEGREQPIGYQLIEDAAQYEAWPEFSQPALIFHGTEDASVPVEYSEEFARRHPNTRLIRMDSGHELTDVLDQIWDCSKAFLLNEKSEI